MKNIRTVRLFHKKISFLLDVQAMKKLLVISFLTLAVFFLSASFGDSFINPFKVLQTLFGQGSDFDQLIIIDFRMVSYNHLTQPTLAEV